MSSFSPFSSLCFSTPVIIRFESFNGGPSPPGQGTASPNPSQRVDSTTPPPRITSPRLTSPLLHSQHYYNSLKKYQLDTLPVGRTNEEGSKGRVVEVQIHSNVHNNSSSTTGATTGTRRNVSMSILNGFTKSNFTEFCSFKMCC